MNFLSVCSGIEAASVAWHPLGWHAAAVAEVDPFACHALTRHYGASRPQFMPDPDKATNVKGRRARSAAIKAVARLPDVGAIPNFGDLEQFKDWPDVAIDLLVGGTPCQAFSLAGLRKGLDDPRGNLTLVYLAILARYRPRWLVWENVPGVLSDKGNAFGALLGGMAQLGYGFAYRVLDAQYIRVDGFARAVPQRRRRVFVVGYLGDWRRAAAVLFERESLSGHPAPSRQAGERSARDLGARTQGGGGLGTDFGCDGGLIARAVKAAPKGHRDDPSTDNYIACSGGNNQSGPIDVATAQTAHGGAGRIDFASETFIAQGVALRGRDGGATAELTGDVMTSLRCGGGGGDKPHVILPFDETQITSADNRCNPQPGDPSHPLAKGARPPTITFSAKDHGADAMEDVSPTLRAGGHSDSHANAGVMPAIAFDARQSDVIQYGECTGPLDTDGQTMGILQSWRVRRLMPVECERLQGFPDGYTEIPYRGRNWTPDWPRYKALGNSMAVNAMRWIGTRISIADTIDKDAAA